MITQKTSANFISWVCLWILFLIFSNRSLFCCSANSAKLFEPCSVTWGKILFFFSGRNSPGDFWTLSTKLKRKLSRTKTYLILIYIMPIFLLIVISKVSSWYFLSQQVPDSYLNSLSVISILALLWYRFWTSLKLLGLTVW